MRRASTAPAKKEGDISSVFVSLSGAAAEPLPPRFAELKARLIAGYEEQLLESWQRLVEALRAECDYVKSMGSRVVPEIDLKDTPKTSDSFGKELRKRGVGIIRNVVSEEQALQWKEDIRTYVRNNPQTKGL